jgi:hypothetical protein
MRKLLYTFSLFAALLCAAAPSAFAKNLRRNSGKVQNFNSRYRQQSQFGNRYGQPNFQQRYQQPQFGNQYGRQTQGYGPNGRYAHGDIRGYGRSFKGYDHYYGDNFIVDREFEDWGHYGYPYPYLFSDCYQGDWIYQPVNGRWFINVWFHDRLVTAYWDPYLGGYYYYDPYMDSYIQLD